MNLSALKRKEIIYLIPYLLLLVLGAWYRYHISGMVYLEDDSDHYLLPAIRKAVTGEWHKGERPMQYLLFVYYTLSDNIGVGFTIILQQALGIFSAVFLAIAWIRFICDYSRYKWLWHLLGYMMIGIYISSPAIMYYEQLLAPESFCICIMSLLICVLVFAFTGKIDGVKRAAFVSIAIFINLYLANPMTKWVFSSVALEILLVYLLFKQLSLTSKRIALAIALPHLLYFLVVWLPESTHKPDLKSEDRVYIEFEQMAYSHFDLLAPDKSNFGLNPMLQDSLMTCFKAAARPTQLMKFSNDELMWGKASALIAQYYNHNYDSIEQYYICLDMILVAKYPLGLTYEIGKQVMAFYIPNYITHKDLFSCVDFDFSYSQNNQILNRIEPVIIDYARRPPIPGWEQPANLNSVVNGYRLSAHYPLSLAQAEVYNINHLPLIFTKGFWFYRFFSPLFLVVMVAFFALQTYKRRLLRIHIISLLYVLIFIYVITIAIVHTFDGSRFVITIYPFLLMSTCMAIAYTGNFALNKGGDL